MKWFHRHHYVPTAVWHGKYVIGGGYGTDVLERCVECGKTRVRNVHGMWMLQQLVKGREGRDDSNRGRGGDADQPRAGVGDRGVGRSDGRRGRVHG